MSRGFPSTVLTALSAQHVVLVTFVKIEFASGTIYLNNSIGTFTFNGNSYQGVGDLGQISQIEEGAVVSPYAITLSLSGLDTTIAGAALNEDYYQRPVTVFLGVLNDTGALIADPTVVWEGFIDQMNVSLGADDGDVISLVAESELTIFDKSSNLKYTHAQQQKEHSGDLFFEFMTGIDGAKIRWGSAESDGVAGSTNDIRITSTNEGPR